MRNRLQRFMMGRYGVDALNRTVLAFAFIFMVLSMIFTKAPFYTLTLICLFYCYFRMFSRNIPKRYRENQIFLEKTAFITRWFSRQKGYSEIRKSNFRIYACPSCKQKVKVPKGKGKISIHCPKCGCDFIKKS